MTNEPPNADVLGIGKRPLGHRSPHGTPDPYDEYLAIEVDDEEIHVPVTNVSLNAYDYYTNGHEAPTRVTFNRVFWYDGEIHADGISGDVVVEYRQDTHGNEEMHLFDLDSHSDDDGVIWER